MNKKPYIVILMPREGSWPSGGLKVILEYANRMSEDGYNVKLIFPLFRINEHFDIIHRLYFFFFTYLRYKITKKYVPTWIQLSKNIKYKFVWSLEKYHYSKNDVFISTAIHTAYSLDKYRVPSDNKYYFIQDFENWDFSYEEVIRSYKFNNHKIVIAKWLHNILSSNGISSDIVPNGFHLDVFKINKSILERDRKSVIALYHRSATKDMPTLFAALDIVHHKIADIKVNLFGVPPQPANLPFWITYHQTPPKDELIELYNNAAIYVGSSKIEGWGLPVGEAMCCGCAVACTNNDGYLEMAKDNETALVSEVENPKALANNIIKLINDNELRYRIAMSGNKHIQEFDINKSSKKFEDIVTENIR